MLELKPLSPESIPSALVKAKHYRLLGEPWESESICRDILRVEPEHQEALLFLVLAITDQFALGKTSSYPMAKELCEKLLYDYQQFYFRGLVEERMAKTMAKRTSPRSNYIAYEYYQTAIAYFEKAEKLSPKDNQDAVLRWNACVRGIREFKLEPAPEENSAELF